MPGKEEEDGGTMKEEEKPINSVDKGEDHGEVKVEPRRSRSKGIVVSRTRCLVFLIALVVLIALVAIISGVIGKVYFGCDGDSEYPEGTYRPTPRPTVPSHLPWSEIRLPGSIIPSYYDLKLTVDLGSFTFNGSVDIHANVTGDTEHVILHANALTIRQANITVMDLNSKKIHRISEYVEVPENQFYVLVMRDWLKRGEYRIHFGEFSGRIEDDLRGLYRSMYKDAEGRTM